MVLQPTRSLRKRLYSISACLLAVAVATAACDKAPLLAPGGTVIYLTAGSSSVSANGTIDIIAVLVEQGTADSDDSTSTSASGTPVHNGTLVSFTTNIGRIEPAEAQTQNGRVVVKFIGDGRSGAATILAYSGGARSEIALNVGGAAAERIVLSATPLSSSGGTSTVTAKVEDTSGNPLAGVAVQFTASTGSLSANSAITNDAGIAAVTLTATSESAVTATVGSKTASVTVTPATRSGLTITAPTTITASSPAAFTIGVSSGANVKSVRVDWGDGSTTNLGAISSSTSVQHTYGSGGNYTVSATATMADNSVEPSVSTSVSVGEFSVTLTSTGGSSTATVATFQAQVAPNTTNIREYRWDFGDGHGTTTNGNTGQHQYEVAGTYTVTVTVVPVTGGSRSTSLVINVS